MVVTNHFFCLICGQPKQYGNYFLMSLFICSLQNNFKVNMPKIEMDMHRCENLIYLIFILFIYSHKSDILNDYNRHTPKLLMYRRLGYEYLSLSVKNWNQHLTRKTCLTCEIPNNEGLSSFLSASFQTCQFSRTSFIATITTRRRQCMAHDLVLSCPISSGILR